MRGRVVLMSVLLGLAAPPLRAEWRWGAYLGGARSQNTSLLVNQPASGTRLRFHDVSFTSHSFELPLYYGLRAGYFLGGRLGLEAEFIHQKVFAEVDRNVPVEGVLRNSPLNAPVRMDTLVGRFNISHGLNLLLGNLVVQQDVWRLPWQRRGRVLLAGRLGVGATIPHPESEVLGVSQQHYQLGRPAAQLAGGVEFYLWQGLYWLAEYKYTRTRQQVRIAGGTAETLLHSHHTVIGLAYHF